MATSPDPTPPGSLAPDPAARPTPERRAASTLLAACLLAFASGSVDAFSYLNHGHVFASAISGDCVLLGAALLGGHFQPILHYALPPLAFLLGVLASEALQDSLATHAVTAGLALETLGLFACSFLPPTFPALLFTPLLSFLIAYQVTSFRHVDSLQYNSAFLMNDLRSTFVGFYDFLRSPAGSPARAAGAQQSRELGTVILAFIAGAAGGGHLARPLGNHTLWLPSAVLATVFPLVFFRLSKDPGQSPS